MDAVRLLKVSRHALTQSGAVLDIVGEAWQAQALAQAIGGHLAASGPPELRGEARGLSEAGSRGCAVLDHPGLRRSAVRASQLSEVGDATSALTSLAALLGDVAMALVSVACATDDEALYWQCMEAIDAADESTDRVRGMLRRITLRTQERSTEVLRDSATGPP
ncbi:DUF6099 family protein [Streptomyces sp. NBC_00083]|uniref:DUF6099 family protein n=1 Tax=Streptomyces sp. NBC_00083 TaxID=2975647 RepID=UPI00224F895F|nr:DUF6099 family protein [Streptomyces sp. NBC_00083]MCX5386244.1 DUF6099 family protein [Streptomyces sp. NBC_00083]